MANIKAEASVRGSKKAKSKTNEVRPGRPYTRMPWEREECAITFDPDSGRTHQSFKDECDVNKIIELHVRTGIVTHLNPGKPQYGDVPAMSLHEAACISAEVRSAQEEGWTPPSDEIAPEGDSEAPERPAEAAPVSEKVEQGGE